MSDPESLVERLLGLERRAFLTSNDNRTLQEAAAELSTLRSRCAVAEAALDQLHGPLSVAALVARAERAEAARDEAVRALEEAREALRVIATGSGYEWSETREQLHRIIDAAVECASNALTPNNETLP